MLWWILVIGASDPACPAETTRRDLQLADGSVSSSCVGASGLPEGPIWNRGAGGRMRWIERYRAGQPHGLWVRFSREGQLIERRDYEAGMLSGTWERWYEDGRMRFTVELDDGKKDGAARGWYQDGTTDFRGTFARGLPDGEWQLFSRRGKRQATCVYRNGEEVSEELQTLERALERVHVVERISQLEAPVSSCYERELARRPELRRGGRVDFTFLVTPVGLTAAVTLERSTLSDERVEACIADVLEQLRFPRLVTCELVEVAFPFQLVAKP